MTDTVESLRHERDHEREMRALLRKQCNDALDMLRAADADLDKLRTAASALIKSWRSVDMHPEHRSGLRIAADQLEALLKDIV